MTLPHGLELVWVKITAMQQELAVLASITDEPPQGLVEAADCLDAAACDMDMALTGSAQRW